MASKIKLESIRAGGFDSENGDEFVNLVVEYVCGDCRSLVEEGDKFCSYCGAKLVDNGDVEHYSKGKKLTSTEYKKELSLYGE
jgi:predicted amidophosphoribosyltransferase